MGGLVSAGDAPFLVRFHRTFTISAPSRLGNVSHTGDTQTDEASLEDTAPHAPPSSRREPTCTYHNPHTRRLVPRSPVSH